MCYHTKQTKKATEVQKRFTASIAEIELFHPVTHYNGFEFPKMPVIAAHSPDVIHMWNWGLIPNWSQDDDIRKFTLNARIESVKEKNAFRQSVDNRCLVIANGYYEWQWLDKAGKKKSKFGIGIGNDELFAFAGLFSEWTDRETGEIRPTFSILTTQANEVMSEIHNTKKRMPVILKPEDESAWLHGAEIEQFAFPNYDIHLVTENLDPQQSLF